jgi:hypothetical protein
VCCRSARSSQEKQPKEQQVSSRVSAVWDNYRSALHCTECSIVKEGFPEVQSNQFIFSSVSSK